MNTRKLSSLTVMGLMALSLSFASCKKDGQSSSGSDTISNTTDTVPTEGMSSRPLGDTIVKKNGDTIVSTKVDGNGQNATGTQVP
jgi:hypothetical protein